MADGWRQSLDPGSASQLARCADPTRRCVCCRPVPNGWPPTPAAQSQVFRCSPGAQVTTRPTTEHRESSELVRVDTDGLLGTHVHPPICVAPASGDVIVV